VGTFARAGGEDTTFEAKDSEKVRGPRPRIELPRTGCLETKYRKVRGQGQGFEDTFENTAYRVKSEDFFLFFLEKRLFSDIHCLYFRKFRTFSCELILYAGLQGPTWS